MPYRTLPPHRRPWWEQMAGAWLVGWIIQGVYGIVYASPALSQALGLGQLLYCAACITLGAVGLYAWWRGYRSAVTRTMVTLAALTVAHGLGVWVMTGPDGGQTAIRLLQAATGTAGWIGNRNAFGLSRNDVHEAVAQIEDDDAGRSKE